jgi:hypothetical protein
MHLKKCYRKGCKIFSSHMDKAPKDKVQKLEDHVVLKYFEDVFKDILGPPPNKDINFSINLMVGATPT